MATQYLYQHHLLRFLKFNLVSSDSHMANWRFLIASLVLFCLTEACSGVTFSSLKETLLVTTSASPGQELKAGEDRITIAWSLNNTYSKGTDSTYKTVNIKLCYAPISQVDRAWRKTEEDLKKDKTCQFKIVSKPYSPSNNSVTWTVEKDIPTATYFVRAYALNSEGIQAAFGQSTDFHKKTNLFKVEGITGRHASLYIASASFSAFSILALLGFFYVDKQNAKRK